MASVNEHLHSASIIGKKKKKKITLCLTQFLATEVSLKMMKKYFCFTFKILFVLNIFIFCPDFLGHVEKRLDKKVKVNFRYKYKSWLTSQEVKAI